MHNLENNFTNLSQEENYIYTQYAASTLNFLQVNVNQQYNMETQANIGFNLNIATTQAETQYEVNSSVRDLESIKEKCEEQHDYNYDVESGPCLRLSIYSCNPETYIKELTKVYYITPKGVKESQRENKNKDKRVLIGRLEKEGDTIKNDIVLSNDKNVSRYHCFIDYSEGFKKQREVDSRVAFLMMNHFRLGSKINVPQLPTYMLYDILSYAKEVHRFYLVDSGSAVGTFIKLQRNDCHLVQRGDIYCLGNEIIATVREVSSGHEHKNIRMLIQYLSREARNKTNIIGLNRILSHEIEKELSSNLSQDVNGFIYEHGFPFILMDVGNQNSNDHPRTYLILSIEQDFFNVGRMSNIDVVIPYSTISRYQCRLKFFNGLWLLQDGSNTKESLNGTWISVSGVWERMERKHSGRFALTNGDEIKVAEFYLRVEFLNENRFCSD